VRKLSCPKIACNTDKSGNGACKFLVPFSENLSFEITPCTVGQRFHQVHKEIKESIKHSKGFFCDENKNIPTVQSKKTVNEIFVLPPTFLPKPHQKTLHYSNEAKPTIIKDIPICLAIPVVNALYHNMTM